MDTFTLGRYEVTREEYAAFVATTRRTISGGCRVMTVTDEGQEFNDDLGRSWRDPRFDQGDGHQVVSPLYVWCLFSMRLGNCW